MNEIYEAIESAMISGEISRDGFEAMVTLMNAIEDDQNNTNGGI